MVWTLKYHEPPMNIYVSEEKSAQASPAASVEDTKTRRPTNASASDPSDVWIFLYSSISARLLGCRWFARGFNQELSELLRQFLGPKPWLSLETLAPALTLRREGHWALESNAVVTESVNSSLISPLKFGVAKLRGPSMLRVVGASEQPIRKPFCRIMSHVTSLVLWYWHCLLSEG